MSDAAWERISAWRDQRMGETGDLWHRAIIDPVLLEIVGPVRGLRVMDLACGNGYLARRFAKDGAKQAVGIDGARGSIERARAREAADPRGVRFEHGDSADLGAFRDGSFDLVVANMALMDIEDAAGTVREVARVLHRDGRFVFSLCHPCFDTDQDSMWVLERSLRDNGVQADRLYRKVSGYRDERAKSVPWHVSDTETLTTTTFQRTLSTYSRYLREAGLAITRLEEPMPLPEAIAKSNQGPFLVEIPLHLIVEAARSATRPPRAHPNGGAAADRVRPGSRRSARSRRRASPRSGSARRRPGTGAGGRGSTAGW
jgi:ubiquinone/menaquinone biosynthesis C-methylase UbiE